MSASRRLPLQDLALAPATLRAYSNQLSSFLTHANLSTSDFYRLSARRLDTKLARFIQYSYDAQSPFPYAAHALHAVVFHRPDVKLALPVARQCLRGWERVKKSTSHPPLTWELTVLLACTLAQSGYHGPGLALLLGFDCYLRVSELTGLRRRDIVMPHDARMGRAHTDMAVCLPRTKTGPNQSVSLQNTDVAELLCIWVRALPRTVGPDGLIFAFSRQWLRQLLRNACVGLGLGHIPYVPHSLRHGGATADFLRTGSVEHVHFRGRWKSIESTRTYIQTARALLAAQQVPARLNRLGMQLSDDLVAAMDHLRTTVPAVVPRPRAARRRVTFADGTAAGSPAGPARSRTSGARVTA